MPEATQIADRLENVTVLFADLVRFTEHASHVVPHELVVVLDEVFTRFDELADRVGMEKIKTVGDAYMAVAGAPDPRPDHARPPPRWRWASSSAWRASRGRAASRSRSAWVWRRARSWPA